MGLFGVFRKKRQQIKNHKKELKREQLFLQVRKLLTEEFNIENKDNINPESRLREDLGLDSVDVIQAVMALEQEFDFEIPDEDTERISTIRAIVDYLLTRLK